MCPSLEFIRLCHFEFHRACGIAFPAFTVESHKSELAVILTVTRPFSELYRHTYGQCQTSLAVGRLIVWKEIVSLSLDRYSRSGISPVTVHFNVGNISGRNVDEADLFGDPGNVVGRKIL